MQIAVTGISGFVGRHLAADLRSSGHAVVGVGRAATVNRGVAQDLAEYRRWTFGQEIDLRDIDAVIHLAGLSNNGASFGLPQEFIEQNSRLVTQLGEAVVRSPKKCRVILASSGAVYEANGAIAVDETARVKASSPYVVSKLLIENQAEYYRSRGVDVVVARPFNHIGPGQGTGFILPDLVDQLRTSRERENTVRCGDLSTSRDYTDVRDVARAYRCIAESALEYDLYNVCSGVTLSGYQLLEACCDAMGIRRDRLTIEQSSRRPTDPPSIVGSANRLNALGWVAQRKLHESVQDFVEESINRMGVVNGGS